MTDSTWIPGLIVLAVGLAAGLFLGWKLRKQKSADSAELDPEQALTVRDLEARRDDLYRRLRSAADDQLSPIEKQALETAAARTLMKLDEVKGQMPEADFQDRSAEPPITSDPSDRPAPAARSQGRHPVLVGFASGALLMALVAMLVYWANRDARPRPDSMGGDSAAVPVSDEPHSDQTSLSPEIAARVAELQARLEADPNDWMAKKELALTLMSGAQFFEAFKLSDEILQSFPDDPDALLVQGVVRMTMGQSETALDMLDRVLAQHPDHLQALLYRGLALYQSGQTERAIDSWEMGLQMAGGSHPDFEEVLAKAAAQPSPPVSGSTAAAPQTQTAPSQSIDR